MPWSACSNPDPGSRRRTEPGKSSTVPYAAPFATVTASRGAEGSTFSVPCRADLYPAPRTPDVLRRAHDLGEFRTQALDEQFEVGHRGSIGVHPHEAGAG